MTDDDKRDARLAAYRKRWPNSIGEELYSGPSWLPQTKIRRYAVEVYNDRYGESFIEFRDSLQEIERMIRSGAEPVEAVHDLDEGRDLEFTTSVRWR